MTTRALLTKEDAARLANAARETGCAIVVERDGARVTILPDVHSLKKLQLDSAGEKAPISLDAWRNGDGRAGKGARRA